MKFRLLLAGLVVSLAVAGSALGSSKPSLLSGIFQSKISGKSPALNGTWNLKIDSFTKYTLKKNGKLVSMGTAAGANGKLAIADTGGKLACKGIQVGGAYTYKVKGNKVTFKATTDLCGGRKAVLTAQAFTKIGNA